MAGNLQPLDDKFAITGPDGRPTLYFIQWAQDRQIDITGAITAEQFNELLLQYLLDHKLQEGSGIQITPSGNLSDSPTIAADAQEILDQISTTRGTVIYRGLLGWAALAPGTAGHYLKTNGAGADPAWAAVAAGGSAAWALAGAGQTATGVYDFAVDGAKANIDFTGLGTFNEVLVVGRALAWGIAGVRALRVSVDGGASYYAGAADYKTVDSAGVDNNSTAFASHSTSVTAARSLLAHVLNMKGVAKVCDHHNGTGIRTVFEVSALDINALRITSSGGGNSTAGTVRLYAR